MKETQNITLVCNPKDKLIQEDQLEQLIKALEKTSNGIVLQELDKAIAYSIKLQSTDNSLAIREQIRSVIGEQEIDIFIEDYQNKNKRLVVCDMESTIIENEFLDDIAEIYNIKPQIEEITSKAMNGQISFNESIIERVGLLKGINKAEIEAIYQSKVKYNQGALKMAEVFKQEGKHAIIVSGGFTLFTDMLLKKLPFKEAYANKLHFTNNKLDGLQPPILNGESKEVILLKYCEDNNIPLNESIAIGDGSNDLFMLKRAGLGVAYKAKTIVKQQVVNQINYSDFTSLLYIQGYKDINL